MFAGGRVIPLKELVRVSSTKFTAMNSSKAVDVELSLERLVFRLVEVFAHDFS